VFPDLIDRDRINITAANRKKDIRYVAENNQFLQALREADRLAQGMIAPFGECLHEIYRQTGDLDFIQTTLSGLLPPLRDLGDLTSPSRHRYPERFSEDAAAALVKLWREIFVFAYDRGGVIESLNPQKLKSSCRVLAYIFCSRQSWEDKQATLGKLIAARRSNDVAGAEKRLAKLDVDEKQLQACHARALTSQRDQSKEDQSHLKDELRAGLRAFAERQDFYKRPYTAIIVASIFAQLRQHEAGVVQLELWLARQTDNTIETRWLKVRALNILIYLIEFWIRQEGENASIVLRDLQLDRLDMALKLVDDLFDFRTEIRKSRGGTKMDDFVRAAFSRPPTESASCLSKKFSDADAEAVGSQKKLYWWYINNYALAARHRLQHPDYAKHHAHLANEAITDLLLADLGCADALVEDKLAIRVWFLRLYATMQVRDAAAQKGIKDRSSVEAMLDNGLRAADQQEFRPPHGNLHPVAVDRRFRATSQYVALPEWELNGVRDAR
jgi:hypothetical protein